MHVQMADGLAAIPPLIHDQSVPGFLEPEGTGYVRGHHEEVPGQRRVHLIDLGDATKVAHGDYQDMGRRLRSEIMEGDDVVVSMEYLRGDLTVGDPAEDAIGHSEASSVVAPQGGRSRPPGVDGLCNRDDRGGLTSQDTWPEGGRRRPGGAQLGSLFH